MGISIKGLQKLSAIDYPGKTCAIVFLPDCNFRCPFCQNPDLIERPGELEAISEEEVIDLVKSRRKWIDGVCITGGEPCIHKDLPDFIRKVKQAGFLIKLDTNGTNPGMLRELLKEGLLDYIAMDIKAPLEKYREAAGVEVDKEAIQKSVKLIMGSGVDYEFRTTVLPRLHSRDDMEAIGKWLHGAERYRIQGFRPENCLDRSFRKEGTFSKEELEELALIARKHIRNVEVRN